MARDLHDTADLEERVILFAVEPDERNSRSTMETEACLDELEELVRTAGAVAVARSIQRRERVHPGHYLGKGKIEELKMMVDAYGASGVVCDDELSPAQLKNLERLLETKVMDRTIVILDIFAGRAISGEGKIQVELAQLKYRLSRLTGMGASMSRLGGGIGTRGPGEKKLETDRRYIKDRIAELNSAAKEIQTHRELLRSQRGKKGTPVVSLVGYTNAGKSTLINKLTDAGVLAEDKLFATLDTTTRKVELPNGSEILLTDTVGFIQKLPHHLVQAFRATLEELKYADILLHVVDASNSNRQEQMQVVYKTLEDLGCGDTPVITVFNKMDREVELPLPMDTKAREIAQVSAFTGDGLNGMLGMVENLLKSFRKSMVALVPYTEGGLIGWVHGRCEIIREEHTPEGVLLEVYVNEESANRLEKYKQ
ncbi:GTPase HflX [Anaerotignum propionicum]|jgi:GTP-binding protein HflX|uniref:GTPase HflX n=1 Tax=Anaerotignum propionicum DSM 1682 TaxID=991789 RepID=A0A0X8VAJ7_ANAPI|nr:GTPase HflX [Anaerotignum propionicum]AMJ42062.1 GTPase HflX [Anaerotignum propionicum DSM 1682]SHE50578.1 GTP-binding protein HflX [[Clostridium] propionicum DSM 1682] [Anaerotignum propionicum DSM 1682]